MRQTGPQIPAFGLDRLGFRNVGSAEWNLPMAALVERAVARGEGHVAKDGPLVVKTGIHTGRSAGDKFVSREPSVESQIWWDNNKSITPAQFDLLHQAFMAYAQGKDVFVQDLFGGADPDHRLPVRVVTELAWHSLFIQHLLIEPTAAERTARPAAR
jgi:phosphoenolpyruvate carboxykinase (ATP)